VKLAGVGMSKRYFKDVMIAFSVRNTYFSPIFEKTVSKFRLNSSAKILCLWIIAVTKVKIHESIWV
jgi:hypothetical protein